MTTEEKKSQKLAIKQAIADYRFENERMRAQIAMNNQTIIKLEFKIEELGI